MYILAPKPLPFWNTYLLLLLFRYVDRGRCFVIIIIIMFSLNYIAPHQCQRAAHGTNYLMWSLGIYISSAALFMLVLVQQVSENTTSDVS